MFRNYGRKVDVTNGQCVTSPGRIAEGRIGKEVSELFQWLPAPRNTRQTQETQEESLTLLLGRERRPRFTLTLSPTPPLHTYLFSVRQIISQSFLQEYKVVTPLWNLF